MRIELTRLFMVQLPHASYVGFPNRFPVHTRWGSYLIRQKPYTLLLRYDDTKAVILGGRRTRVTATETWQDIYLFRPRLEQLEKPGKIDSVDLGWCANTLVKVLGFRPIYDSGFAAFDERAAADRPISKL
jgi:hypothetical protein